MRIVRGLACLKRVTDKVVKREGEREGEQKRGEVLKGRSGVRKKSGALKDSEEDRLSRREQEGEIIKERKEGEQEEGVKVVEREEV